ncbi:hypothetical protein [Rhodobacter sp. NSM]|uniref:hypothetical protein n=1 Tax=Rhodobacter sp. NSM TaxID=3457501 RepID=UPI003FD579F4
MEADEDWLPEAEDGMPAERVATVVSFSKGSFERPAVEEPRVEQPLAEEPRADSACAEELVAPDEEVGEAVGLGAIDEQHLRELVRAAIREELQGAMGERITQNIRKLVRAEMHRAILTRNHL